MSRPQISVLKRKREQARRERQELKAERRANRKNMSAEEASPSVLDNPTSE